ncbi:MAG: folylpolyglutamate synthase/dihydrofolate synthase family protein [Arcicella sp.]|nr:folylpolyglutamate synthase/dihydrofolate synthase family protein [Arcicella sp.]
MENNSSADQKGLHFFWLRTNQNAIFATPKTLQMTYEETITYLYEKLPVFHRIGKSAYKADLSNTIDLCKHLDNPHQKFKTIHVAGTNGKGSTSHYLAAILQSAGYKTGLYTSPHLKSFTERIRIHGEPIPENKVVEFVESNQDFIEELKPSFFELSVGMAFDYFANEEVDIAVIEVGLGGRLDSTNIITPVLSVITNISFDHTDILGDTLPKIAFEKAGIIKPHVPVVISERNPETENVFIGKAEVENSPIHFAIDTYQVNRVEQKAFHLEVAIDNILEKCTLNLESQLMGEYQTKNIVGVLKSIDVLNNLGFTISRNHLETGLSKVVNLTGLKGRWQTLSNSPTVLCDTAHNVGGITQILDKLQKVNFNKLWMILGFVSDKDISTILSMLPKDANYVFCRANIQRALPASDLLEKANQYNLKGKVIRDVNEAIEHVKNIAENDDFVFVGGSTFVVAEINHL